jgi:hypothetical protein
METRELIARILLYILSAMGIVGGLVYMFRQTFFAYHIKYIGGTRHEIEPRTADIIMRLRRCFGGCVLALGVTILLLAGRFAGGDDLVRWTLLSLTVISQATALYVTFPLRSYGSPWLGTVVSIVLIVCAFFLS